MPYRIEQKIAVLAIVGACAFLFLFGFIGLGRQGSYGFDFHVFHGAGLMLFEGVDFWQVTADTPSPYSYPPHATIIIALYALFPIKIALLMHTALNLASLALIVFLAHRWFLKITNVSNLSLAQGLGIAVIVGNPFVAHVFFMGQLSIVAVAAVLLSWHMLNTHRWMLSAVFLAIATIKPQIALLYVMWLLLTLEFRVVFLGFLVATLMMLPALIVFGPINAFESWFASLLSYSMNTANDMGAAHVFGVESVLASLGITGSIAKAISLGLACIFLMTLYQHRKQLDPAALVSFLFCIGLLFVYAHDYDLASLGIMYSFLIILALKKRGPAPFIIAMSALVILFFPQRFLRDIELPLIIHWRVFLLPLCCYLVLRFEKRHNGRTPETGAIRYQSSQLV